MPVMQSLEDTEPIVRIRDLKKDRVNFVLENVDLAYVQALHKLSRPHLPLIDSQTQSEGWS